MLTVEVMDTKEVNCLMLLFCTEYRYVITYKSEK